MVQTTILLQDQEIWWNIPKGIQVSKHYPNGMYYM